MTMTVERDAPISGLNDFIAKCGAENRGADTGHASTAELLPLISKYTSRRVFESRPEAVLVAPEVWNAVAVGSRVHYIGKRMLQFDALADYLQKIHYRRLKWVCVGVLAFMIGFEVFAHVFEDWPVVLMGALLCLGAAFVVVVLQKSREVQMAYLSTRTIAEMLRIMFFVEMSGAAFSPNQRVFRRYRPVLASVLAVLDQVQIEAHGLQPAPALAEKVVRQAWFDDQTRHFRKSTRREESAAVMWTRISSFAFGLAISAIIALAIESIWHGPHTVVSRTLLVGAPCLLGVAAISQFYLERRGFKGNSLRYLHSVLMYEVQSDDWDADVRDVAAEALHEIVDWYVSSVEREICVPR